MWQKARLIPVAKSETPELAGREVWVRAQRPEVKNGLRSPITGRHFNCTVFQTNVFNDSGPLNMNAVAVELLPIFEESVAIISLDEWIKNAE